MKSVMLENPSPAAECESRQLVSDLFHQLSQPLTTLCCSLELALLQTPTPEEYGEILSHSLRQAEKACALTTAIRELFDASQVGEGSEVLNLRLAVEDTVGDLRPVAESMGMQVCCLPGPACPVWFDAPRLRQGLFHLIGYVIGLGGPTVKIKLAEDGTAALLVLTVSRAGVDAGPSSAHSDQELLRRLGLGIARAIFEAAGGSLHMQRGPETWNLEVRLLRNEAV